MDKNVIFENNDQRLNVIKELYSTVKMLCKNEQQIANVFISEIWIRQGDNLLSI